MNPKASAKEENAKAAENAETKYELMLIMVPDLSQDDMDKELKKIKKQITDLKGEIYHEDNWDVRDLAYLIKKHDKGYYVILYFTFPSESIKELEKDLFLNKKVLRHLFVKSPKGYEIKKLADFELTEEDLKAKRKPKEEEEPAKKAPAKKVTPKPEPVPEKEEEKAKPAPKTTEESAEEKPEKEETPKKESKKTMADIDSQLESILDDPDMDIKL